MKRFIASSAVRVRPDRIRKEFDEGANQDLQSSISDIGLLQPIVLEFDGLDYWLVAGERRLIAIKELSELGVTFSYDGEPVPLGLVPHVLLSDLSELERLQVEVDENNKRVQFSWQEKAQAAARIERLKVLQAQADGTTPPTVTDIAKETRGETTSNALAATRKDLIVARHLDDPDVAKAKTAADAFKVIKRKEEAARNAFLAESVGASLTASRHQCVNADFFVWAGEQPDEQFDLILMDPPYGMGADEFGDSGGQTGAGHAYDDSAETVENLIDDLPAVLHRLACTEAHAYIFCDIDWFPAWREAMTIAGWRVFRTPLIWLKPGAYRAPWPEHGPQRKYECILYAIKGDKRTLKLGGDVLSYNPDENLGHNAQKPVDLYLDLISRSVRPGSRILDGMCGSGTIFPAAHQARCYATGIERDPTHYGLALRRLQALDGGEPELNLGV